MAVGFGISKPEHVKQVREVTITSSALLIKEWLILWLSLTPSFAGQIAEWGADGVIIGSAIVRQLVEATSPQQGLKQLEDYARSMKNALPYEARLV